MTAVDDKERPSCMDGGCRSHCNGHSHSREEAPQHEHPHSGCDDDEPTPPPVQKKPKLWAHHLLAVVVSPDERSEESAKDEGFAGKDDSGEEQQQQQQHIVRVHDPRGFSAIFREDVQLVVWERPELPGFVRTLSRAGLDQSGLPSFYGTVTPDNCAELLTKELLVRENSSSRSALTRAEVGELVADIHRLVVAFHDVLVAGAGGDDDDEADDEPPPPPGVHVRLERLDNDGCVFWHQDTVPLRLVTTYRGPCTEYVDPEHAEDCLRNRKEDSPHARSLGHSDVALFKGRLFYGDEEDEEGDEEDDEEHPPNDHGNDGFEHGTSETNDPAADAANTKEPGAAPAEEDEDDDDELPDLTSPGIVHRSPRIEGSDLVRLVLVLDIPADFHELDDNDDDEDNDDEDNDNEKDNDPEEDDPKD